MHPHPATPAASGFGAVSTAAAGRGGAFGHHLWRTLYGAERSQFQEHARRQLAELMGLLPVVEHPMRAGEFYASIRAALAAEGEMIGNNDLWIAANANAAGLILVTNNARAFRGIRGLEIENWAD